MIGLEFKIIFSHNFAYLIADKPMTYEQLNLPDIAKKFNGTAFWNVRVLKHIESEQRLNLEIINYNVGETGFTNFTKEIADKLDNVKKITFQSIDTGGLMSLKGGQNRTYNHPKSKEQYGEEKNNNSAGTFTTNYTNIQQHSIVEPVKRIINETFSVSIKDIDFRTGSVAFCRKFIGFTQIFEIEIKNDEIIEEFDAIKNYFSKVFNTKKIQVTATIVLSDNVVVSSKAESPEISKINKDLIDYVKFEYFTSAKRNSATFETEKTIFTVDEYFDTFSNDNFISSIFFGNENELLDNLLKISNTKHYRHLRFLSSKHADLIMRLRIVSKPFSYIFLIEGQKNYHFIWETLDTKEATYIWHIEKRLDILKSKLLELNSIIGLIKVEGKISYINSNEDQLTRIYHDYSELVDGFAKWRTELENILI